MSLPKLPIHYLRQLSLLSFNNAVAAAFSYVLTIYLANKLGPEDFGLYSFILIVSSVISVLIAYSTDSTTPVLFARSPGQCNIVNIVLALRAFFALMSILGILFYSAINSIVAFGLIALLPTSLNLSFLYEIKGQTVKYSYIYLMERSLYLLVIMGIIFLFGIDLEKVLGAILFVTTFSIMYQALDNRKYLQHWDPISFKRVKWIILDNFPLVVISLSVFSYGGFSRLILEQKLGLSELGIYSAGWQFITIGTIFQSQVTRVWRISLSIALAKNDLASLLHQIKLYLLLSTLPIILFSLLIAWYAHDLVNFIFSFEYAKLSKILPIFSLYLIVINLNGLSELLWIGSRRNYLYMIITIFFGLSLIFVLMLLSPTIGIKGIAVATVSTHALATAVLIIIWWLLARRKAWD